MGKNRCFTWLGMVDIKILGDNKDIWNNYLKETFI